MPFDDANAACCDDCEGHADEFLSVSIQAQLKRKLENPTFWGHLQKWFETIYKMLLMNESTRNTNNFSQSEEMYLSY
jgi:hypothetical protein